MPRLFPILADVWREVGDGDSADVCGCLDGAHGLGGRGVGIAGDEGAVGGLAFVGASVVVGVFGSVAGAGSSRLIACAAQ